MEINRELINTFLAKLAGLSDNTIRSYRQTLWSLHAFCQGHLTEEALLAFLQQFEASTLQRHKAPVKQFVESQGIVWPFSRQQFRKPRRRLPKFIEPEQIRALIASAQNEDDRMFIETLFILGCRIAELMGIRQQDITSRGVLVTGKGDYEGVIPVVEEEFLRRLQNYAKGKNGRVFPQRYNFYRKHLRELAAQLGVETLTPHMLRHSRAVDLLDKGMSELYLQQFLRHVSLATTSIYTKVTGTRLRSELQRVENGARAHQGAGDIS